MLGPFCLHGCWQEDEGKAERLAQRVLSRAKHGRAVSWTPSPGGWVTAKCVSPVDGDSAGAALGAAAVGRVGTNPECAVKSTDKFLMLPSRIEDEIKD